MNQRSSKHRTEVSGNSGGICLAYDQGLALQNKLKDNQACMVCILFVACVVIPWCACAARDTVIVLSVC